MMKWLFHLSKLSIAKFSILYDIPLVKDWKRKLKLITLESERVNSEGIFKVRKFDRELQNVWAIRLQQQPWNLAVKQMNSTEICQLVRQYNFIKETDKTYCLRLLLPIAFIVLCVGIPLIRFGKFWEIASQINNTIFFHILTMEAPCNSRGSFSLVFFIRSALIWSLSYTHVILTGSPGF